MCEIVSGVECEHDDDELDLGDDPIEVLGDLVAVEYRRADGHTYRHTFNPETDELAYAKPGVLLLIGQFDVDGGGIGPDHDDGDDDED